MRWPVWRHCAACQREVRDFSRMTEARARAHLLLFGGDLWYGMAAVIMFGLGVGAVLSLAVVPVLYSFFFRMRREEQARG